MSDAYELLKNLSLVKLQLAVLKFRGSNYFVTWKVMLVQLFFLAWLFLVIYDELSGMRKIEGIISYNASIKSIKEERVVPHPYLGAFPLTLTIVNLFKEEQYRCTNSSGLPDVTTRIDMYGKI